jgi:putative membrane protein
MFTRTLMSIACGLCLLPGIGTAVAAEANPAAANPTFANPDTPGLLDGKPAPDVPNVSDVVFLKQFAIGSRAEVELGKLAGQRGSAPGVDEFARHMIKDHGEANTKLASLARASKVSLPEELDAEHVAARGELLALNGPAFDLKYIEGQIKDHQKAVQLLTYEITAGQHAGIRGFAADTLPRVMQHLEAAKSVHAQLTKADPALQRRAPPHEPVRSP